MKARLIFLTISLVAVTASDEQLWLKFKKDNDKFYTSKTEELLRFNIFKQNLKEINDHNDLYRQGKSKYFKGINQFTDMTKEEFVGKVLGAPMKKNMVEGGIIWKRNVSDFPPESVDWRDKEGIVTAVGKQKCTDHWAFSSTGMMESQYGLNKDTAAITLSKQNLIDCTQSFGNSGCAGGYSYATYQYLIKNGINSEADYPYEGVDGTCRYEAAKKILTVTIPVYVAEKNETEVKMAVASVGPLAVSLDATNMQSYSGGIYQDRTCSTDVLNFAAVLVGYGTISGTDYWIVKCSWGTDWGDKGYIKMERNYNICGIASDASFIMFD